MAPLRFDNKFIERFSLDRGPAQIPRITPGVLGAMALPTKVRSPELIAWSASVATLIGWDGKCLDPHAVAQIFAGNQLIEGSEPYATRYGGHQFGHWANQLGDGRAISLGEVIGVRDETLGLKRSSYEVQLKGAGLTPYSRRGDGRAVLRSSLREFICSEAMHALGVPTTLALSCVLTGDSVTRDMFYDGNPVDEPGAIATRVAPTFLRFGHFEILAAQGELELLRDLVHFTIEEYFPGRVQNGNYDFAGFFADVCTKTCAMIIDWQRVGFVHGVMNTDNMSILGLTIDYGPFGFLDNYDPQWTPNTTDAEGRRYRFANQPEIAYWNLQRLAEALVALDPNESWVNQLNAGLEKFARKFDREFAPMMASKIGIFDFKSEEDLALLLELEKLLLEQETDFTIFYRQLAKVVERNHFVVSQALDELAVAFYSLTTNTSDWEAWIDKWARRLACSSLGSTERAAKMRTINPFIVPRNYLLQEIIDDVAHGSKSKLNAAMQAFGTPYLENESTAEFSRPRPDWARSRPGCSALSCSS